MNQTLLKAGAASCGLMLLLCNATAQALPENNLKGIQLNSNAIETRVILKSRNGVPHRLVSQSPEKIVVDLSAVDPTQSVPTDFTDAENIEQVILKPLSGDKLRLIIRGEDLGQPFVSSIATQAAPVPADKVVFEGESLTPKRPSQIIAPDDRGRPFGHHSEFSTNPTALDEALSPPISPTTAETGTSTTMDAAFNSSGLDNSEDATDLDFDPSFASAAKGDRQAMAADQHAEADAIESEEASWQDMVLAIGSRTLRWAQQCMSKTGGTTLVQCILAIGVFLFIGVWIRRRLRQEQGQYGQNTNRGNIFGSQLDSRSCRQPKSRTKHLFTEADPPPSSNDVALTRRHRGGERPVGLSGLALSDEAYPTEVLEQQKAVVNPRQAVHQYVKYASPPQPQAIHRNSREIDEELQRALQVKEAIYATQTKKPIAPKTTLQTPPKSLQKPLKPKLGAQAPVSRKPAQPQPQPQAKPLRELPQPKAAQQEPGLPANNTEVLDFLRSVAELMEQDGKPELAKGIKKGIMHRRT